MRSSCLLGLLVLIAIVSCPGRTRADHGACSNMRQEAETAAGRAGASAEKAGIARDTAFNALDNAVAVQHEAERKLMEAFKSGVAEKIDPARKALKQALMEAQEAWEIAGKVVVYEIRARGAADSARNEVRSLSEGASEREAEEVARKARRLAIVAEKASVRAERTVQSLKSRWLIPIGEGDRAEESGSGSTTAK